MSSNCDFTIPGPVLYFTGKRWAFSCLFIVREWTIPFVFFSHLKKLISFILKKFVQFISISFIFSVKSFVQYKNKRLLEKFVRSEKKNRCTCLKKLAIFHFSDKWQKLFVCSENTIIHEIFCSFSNISFVHKNDVNLYPRVDAYLWAMPNLRGYLRTIHIYFMGGGGDAMLIIYSI